MNHYNTTQETGIELEYLNKKAKNQEELIYRMFRSKGAKSPSWIYKALGERYPITSIRRAITNLTNRGKLRKTSVKVKGLYGRPEYLWKLNS